MKLKALTIIIFVLFSCNAQDKKMQKQATQKNTKMIIDKFDIETFNKKKINDEYNFVLEDGSKVRQLGSDNYYEEIIRLPKPSFYEIYKKFYKNGDLYLFFISYPNDFLVSKKEYDQTGRLIKEINYDTPYKFTFKQLLELLKKEKDTIDVFDKNTKITRESIDTGTFWYITYKKDWGRREVIKVDGITGEILERSHYPHEDN